MSVDRATSLPRAARAATTQAVQKPVGRDTGGLVFTGIAEVFLIACAIVVIFPFVWMVMTAFKADQEIFFSPWALPTTLHFDNFLRAWNSASIGPYFINSIIVLAGSLTLTLLVSSMAAYVLARFEFQAGEAARWRDTICQWIYKLSGIADQKGRVAKASATAARN